MITMTMMTIAASKIRVIVMMRWDDNDSGVEVMAGMTEWWQWSRREEEENATGFPLVLDCSQILKLFWVNRRNGKRCRRRDKCHNSYKEPEHKYVESHQVSRKEVGQGQGGYWQPSVIQNTHHHYYHDHYVPVYHYSSYWSGPSYGWSSYSRQTFKWLLMLS